MFPGKGKLKFVCGMENLLTTLSESLRYGCRRDMGGFTALPLVWLCLEWGCCGKELKLS